MTALKMGTVELLNSMMCTFNASECDYGSLCWTCMSCNRSENFIEFSAFRNDVVVGCCINIVWKKAIEMQLSRNFKSRRRVENPPGGMGNILRRLIVLILFFCGVIGAENEVKIGKYMVNGEKYSNMCNSSSIRSINQILDYSGSAKVIKR